MSSIAPAGTESQPIFTDAIPVSAATAIVMATAGSAIVLSQTAIRAWRHVSLSQMRGLALARMPLLVLVLLLSAAVASVGAFVLFKDDARKLGGLFPVLGCLAPFVFIARRPDPINGSEQSPTQTNFLGWLFESYVTIAIALPGLACTALCIWGMVQAKSWDVLALAFSTAILVVSKSDPPLYFAWDGIGTRWQWGKLLPCPTRAPSWRCVLGRIEYADGEVEIAVDAMEVPNRDSLSMKGALVAETELLSDKNIATTLIRNGTLSSLPLFYDYVNSVWQHVIHGTKNGSRKEGRLLDETTASCYMLIISIIKEALETEKTLGADVWLLLAILRHRLGHITEEYNKSANYRALSIKDRWGNFWSSIWSTMSGYQRGSPLRFDESDGETKLSPTALEGQDDETVLEMMEEDPDPENEEVETIDRQNPYSSNMLKAFESSDSPPDNSSSEAWSTWVLKVLGDLYEDAVKIQMQNKIRKRQKQSFPSTFFDWLGENEWNQLNILIMEALECEAVRSENETHPNHRAAARKASEAESHSSSKAEKPLSVVEEATTKVAEAEAWTYIMLSLAARHASYQNTGESTIAFESAGIDFYSGELNGRLKAQNAARKIILAQIGLWGYVALGQTAAALLSR